MWSKGTIWTIDTKVGYDYWVKHYEEGSSEFGIDGGRISKLTIRRHGERKDLASYDRGWDMEPATDEIKAICDLVLQKFN
ncbi:hypothetical protein FACS1894196_1130 [Clostridia bacterium]|nr:hypothetical protein FACS1894196_1130 [Clostridia bacterium]